MNGAGDLVVAEVDEPAISRPDQVLLRTLYAGICYTDKHFFEGVWPVAPGTTLGHEASAEVVACGASVEGLEVGARVAVDPFMHCGHCRECRRGEHGSCLARDASTGRVIGADARYDGGQLIPGFFGEYSVVPAANCVPLPTNVTSLAGAVVEVLAVGINAARLAKAQPSDAAAFFGFDDYAFATFQQLPMLRRIVVDPTARRREVARAQGADAVIEPADLADSGGAINDDAPYAVDIAFVSMEDYIEESARYVEAATRVVVPGGRIVIIRQYAAESPTGLGRAHTAYRKGISIEMGGRYFGRSPFYGGNREGEFEVILEQLAHNRLADPAQWIETVDFHAVETSDLAPLFARMPYSTYKVALNVGDERAFSVAGAS